MKKAYYTFAMTICIGCLHGCAHRPTTHQMSTSSESYHHNALADGVMQEAWDRLSEKDYGTAGELFTLVVTHGVNTNLQARAVAILEANYDDFMGHARSRHGPAMELAIYFFERKAYEKSLKYSTDVFANGDILETVAYKMLLIRVMSLLYLQRIEQAQDFYTDWAWTSTNVTRNPPLDLQKVIDRYKGRAQPTTGGDGKPAPQP